MERSDQSDRQPEEKDPERSEKKIPDLHKYYLGGCTTLGSLLVGVGKYLDPDHGILSYAFFGIGLLAFVVAFWLFFRPLLGSRSHVWLTTACLVCAVAVVVWYLGRIFDSANPQPRTVARAVDLPSLVIEPRSNKATVDPFRADTLRYLGQAEAYLSSLSATAPVADSQSPPDFQAKYFKWEAEAAAKFMEKMGAELITARAELRRRGKLPAESPENESFRWKSPTPDMLRAELSEVRRIVERMP